MSTPTRNKLLSKVTFKKLLRVLDQLNKFVPVIITAIITWYANSFESKLSITNLISQREQAESQLRANMFNTLIGPLFGKDKCKDPEEPEHELILTELLSLNFGEHFEIKPLLKHVETTLKNSRNNPEETYKSLNNLWDISKRVAGRQLASLQQQGDKKDYTIIEEATFVESLESNLDFKNYSSLKNNNNIVIVKNYSSNRSINAEYVFSSKSADKKSKAIISLEKANWANNSFSFNVNVENKGSETIKNNQDFNFELSWFDLPLVDNILLSNGNRFCLLLEKVNFYNNNEFPLKYVTLKIVWFPKVFFTPRERPIDFNIVRKKMATINTSKTLNLFDMLPNIKQNFWGS